MSFDLIICVIVAVMGSVYVLLQEMDNWIDDDPFDDEDDLGVM